MAIYTSRSPRTNPGSGRVKDLNQRIQRTSSPPFIYLSVCPSVYLSACLSDGLFSPVSQSLSQSISRSVRRSDVTLYHHSLHMICLPLLSWKINLIFFTHFLLCFLLQNVRHDVVYYYKPAPSNSLQPFEKFTNLPADRQLLLRSRDDFEESRRIYQTIASSWRFQYDNIFGINLAMDLITQIDIYYIYFAVRKEMNSCNKQMQKYANLLLLLSW